MKIQKSIFVAFLLGFSWVLGEGFDDLSKVDQARYRNLYTEAVKATQQQRYFEAILKAQDANFIYNENAGLYEILTSVYVNLKMYDKSLEMAEKVIELKGGDFASSFNLAEIYFVNEKYEEALVTFEKAMEVAPERNYYKDHQLVNLVRFKRLVVFEKLGKKAEFEAEMSKVDPSEDNPLPLMSQSYQHMIDGDYDEAGKIMAKAKRIFRNEIFMYEDALQEAGYGQIRLQAKVAESEEFLKSQN